eukprot:CAMPEP_0202914068 /NCGR_PEP_ID=MMETSP1392-20130828/62159_1 /ASSEMBLY_ACC=CAM_ASM_000868 /TAXON_ID=225041 /ORGANISM="Chlamydomonas chlamydogama, Strain SAG 11-48b" /LENGTH=237 /DNA_ID=CAMNT_0049605583 /DNA_START=176 /DNA_END=889 /DNA_ORIENTATION=-
MTAPFPLPTSTAVLTLQCDRHPQSWYPQEKQVPSLLLGDEGGGLIQPELIGEQALGDPAGQAPEQAEEAGHVAKHKGPRGVLSEHLAHCALAKEVSGGGIDLGDPGPLLNGSGVGLVEPERTQIQIFSSVLAHVALDGPRDHQHDFDSNGLQLHAHGVREVVHCSLTGGVDATEGGGNQAHDGPDIHYCSTSSFRHMWEHCLHHGDGPEYIGFIDLTNFVCANLCSRTWAVHSRIIH